MKIGVSTSWAREDETLTQVIERASGAGFEAFELGVVPRGRDAEDIINAREEHSWQIVSVHNVAINDHLERNWIRGDMIASTDQDQRTQGVEDLQRSMELAAELGATVVVVHAGRVSIPGDSLERHRRLCQAVEQDRQDVVRQMLRQRQRLAQPTLEALARSLEQALAQGPPVRIAIESRYHYDEIPTPDELQWIFRRFDTDALGYWHDVGHCRMSELYGTAKPAEWLHLFEERLLGLHLHDVSGWRDHLPVGKGNADFAAVLQHVGDDVISVVEPDRDWSEKELVASARYLATLGFGEFG